MRPAELHSAEGRGRPAKFREPAGYKPLGAQATGRRSYGEIRHLSAVADSAKLALLLN